MAEERSRSYPNRCPPNMTYQKIYMNHIHSSSLLCQLAQMWREEVLCDAYIRTGHTSTKAHRIVLVAACPMLQSMEGSSMGTVLEVKLAPDIRQDSVRAFLQYLYEGFMMLTEDNVLEIEKIARLLQVDSVTKCCVDFQKALREAAGIAFATEPKCSFHADQAEFRHVRASELLYSTENGAVRRVMNNNEYAHKRARTENHEPVFVFNNYSQGNHIGRQNFMPSKQVIEDSFEIISSEKDPLKPKIHQSLGVKVASHVDSVSDPHVISIPDTDNEQNSYTSPRQSPFTVIHPNRQISAITSSVRKQSPKTVGQSLHSVVKNLSSRPKSEMTAVFTPITSVQNRLGENLQDSKKESEQTDQIIIQPITCIEGDNSPVNSSSKGEDSNDRTGVGTLNSDQEPGDSNLVKPEKANTAVVTMDVDNQGDTDRLVETSLAEDDGEDEYSEGEIYRFADTSGMPGNEDDPGNSWYIDTLKEWLRQSGENEDFETLPVNELDDLLTRFYSTSVLPKAKLWNYPKQVTQYLNTAPWFRGLNICTNSAFDSSNSIATKSYTPSQSQVSNDRRKMPMTQEDLNKLYESGVLSNTNPTSLQNKVWVELMIYIGGLARQDLRNLEKDHFIFEKDDDGKLYYRLDAHFMMDSKKQIRVYEQPDNLNCPVQSLWLYLSKLNPKCPVFFQQPLKESVTLEDTVWYSHRPIGKNAHSTWLASICKEAGITTEYRNTALYCRTAPQVMKSDRGVLAAGYN